MVTPHLHPSPLLSAKHQFGAEQDGPGAAVEETGARPLIESERCRVIDESQDRVFGICRIFMPQSFSRKFLESLNSLKPFSQHS